MRGFLDFLYRPRCVCCTAPATTLCDVCREALVEVRPDAGPPLPLPVMVPWEFGGSLATAIRRLKFTGKTHVARDLAPLWAPLLAAAYAASVNPVIVPIPLHWRRRFARGFDQTWLLARHACRAADLPAPCALLRRVRHAPPQSTLPAPMRRDNLRGAFCVTSPQRVVGRTVLLVDDVVTTGSTLAAAAAPLLAAGARQVIGVTLARTL